MKTQWSKLRRSLAALGLAAALAFGGPAVLAGTSFITGSAHAQQVLPLRGLNTGAPGVAPANNLGNTLGGANDSDIWRQVRHGIRGQVSTPNPASGVLVQSQGDDWRMLRNGPIATYGWWLLAAMGIVLVVFFMARGRIRTDSGNSGKTIERFSGFERFVHWFSAGSFVLLALTGLNTLYGRYLFVMDPAGDSGNFSAAHTAFATFTYYGKFVHNYMGFPFIVGIVLMFVIWVRHNLPDRYDLTWVVKGGGLFMRGVHPPSDKFNFGQKTIFWVVVLSGVALFVTGLSLMFPFYWFGMQDMQLMNLIHVVVALVAIAIMIAHIYIGSLGMEGAFAAMSTGQVDENWAREHHSAWVAEAKGDAPPGGGPVGQPAE